MSWSRSAERLLQAVVLCDQRGGAAPRRDRQVKQKQVGRPDVDAFETTMERAGSTRGVMVGIGFGREAREEVAHARRRGGLEIIFCEAESLLKTEQRQHIVQQLQPGDEQLTMDELLLAMVPQEQPSLDQLMASELRRQREAEGRLSEPRWGKAAPKVGYEC